jgi:hypothetical protein
MGNGTPLDWVRSFVVQNFLNLWIQNLLILHKLSLITKINSLYGRFPGQKTNEEI